MVLVGVLMEEGGGASRWGPTPEGSGGESKTAELMVAQWLTGSRGQNRTLEATRRRGAEPTRWLERFLTGPLTGPIGRLIG